MEFIYGNSGLVAKSCPTPCDTTDCSPQDFSVRGVSQARVLKWVAVSFFRGSSQALNQTRVSLCFLHW